MSKRERIAAVAEKSLFVLSVAVLAVLYGFGAAKKGWFPSALIRQAEAGAAVLKNVVAPQPQWYDIPTADRRVVVVANRAAMSPGLTLVAGLAPGRTNHALLIDADGKALHSWALDWFKLWPKPTHLPKAAVPKQRPGANIHGVILDPNGDLTFNFDSLGAVRLDFCGRVKWRLPYMVHHTLSLDDDGNIWTLATVVRTKPDPGARNYRLPFDEDVILKVSPGGKVLQSTRVFDILHRNGLDGLLYMTPTDNWSTAVATPDTLHANDVEVFRSGMKPGVFAPGDILLSLRNISAVMVVEPRSWRIKRLFIGQTIRQHDADFVDGDSISVFDNHNDTDDQRLGRSRILELSALSNDTRTLYQGDAANPFFSNIMGKHQHLPTGGMLVAESARGRVFEVGPTGAVIWQYFNHTENGLLGILSDAERVPLSTMSPEKIKELASKC